MVTTPPISQLVFNLGMIGSSIIYYCVWWNWHYQFIRINYLKSSHWWSMIPRFVPILFVTDLQNNLLVVTNWYFFQVVDVLLKESTSMLTFEGQQFQGRDDIIKKLVVSFKA